MGILVRPLVRIWTNDLADPIDKLLDEAHLALTGPHGHLDSASERFFEAQTNSERLILVAHLNHELAGIIDTRMHVPRPTDMTICELAVAKNLRFQGVGRTLVTTAIDAGAQQLGPAFRLYASVLRHAVGAYDFWASLGWVDNGKGQFICDYSEA